MAKIRGGYAKKWIWIYHILFTTFYDRSTYWPYWSRAQKKFPLKICPIGKTVCMFTLIDSAKTEAPLLRRVERWKKRGPSDACWYTFLGNFPLITDYDLGRGRGSLFCLCKSTLFKGAKYPTVNPGSALWLYITSKVIQLSGSFCQKSIFDSQ